MTMVVAMIAVSRTARILQSFFSFEDFFDSDPWDRFSTMRAREKNVGKRKETMLLFFCEIKVQLSILSDFVRFSLAAAVSFSYCS